jgi:hypothetical protein
MVILEGEVMLPEDLVRRALAAARTMGKRLPDDFPDDPDALQAIGRCGAPNRQGRFKYCHKAQVPRVPPLEPRRERRARCEQHGGRSVSGPANPAWGQPDGGRKTSLTRREGAEEIKPGRYSNILGGTYADFYRQTMESGEVASLDEQIALCDAREGVLVGQLEERRVERGEADEPWRRVRELVDLCRRAAKLSDEAAYLRHFEELAETARIGAGEAEVWESLHKNMLVRRQLADTQRKTIATLGGFMSIQEAMRLAARIIEAGRDTITDRGDLGRFIMRMQEMFAGVDRPAVKLIGVAAAVERSEGNGGDDGDGE